MGLIIFAGGCRYPTDDGETKRCNECLSHSTCKLEPHARELAESISRQWVSTEDLLPPEATPVLYLEYPSELPAGTVHIGYYQADRGRYIEQLSGELLLEKAVIAWMPLPEVSAEIYKNRRFVQQRPRHVAAAKAVD